MRVASPTTPAALFSYLLGTWTLTKTLEYQRGGRSGNFRGSAQFMPLSAGVEGVLSYEETGVATLEPNMEALEARHALLYDCSDATDVKVYFDEAINRAPADVLTGRRYFHSIDLSSPDKPFVHPCGPDMYYGRLMVTSPDVFVLDWRVEGPRKLGRVVSRFSRSRKG